MSGAGVAGRVTVSPENVPVQAGHDVTINCSSTLATYWTFVQANSSTEPRLICYKGLSLSENHQKYGCDAADNEELWPVVINDFVDSDAGVYSCAVDGLSHASALLTLACTPLPILPIPDKAKCRLFTYLQSSTWTSNLGSIFIFGVGKQGRKIWQTGAVTY